MIKIFGGYWIPKRKIEAIKKMYEQAYKIEKDSKLEKEGTLMNIDYYSYYKGCLETIKIHF